jgi:hypothetical protein
LKNERVGLIGRHDDPEIQLLRARVEDLGAIAEVIDFWHFPRFSVTQLSDDAIVYDGIDLTAIDAFYLRQLGYFSPLPQKEFTKEEWAEHFGKFNDYMTNEREVMSYKESVIQILCELKPVVNPYECAFYHKLKVYQYWKLALEGVPVPEFIAGNEFFEFRKFLLGGPSVVKPLVGGYVNRYAESDLERDKASLRQRPLIIQRQVSGRMLRSFVLAGHVVGTCEIVYQKSDADSRRNIAGMEVFKLSQDHATIPVKACRVLGMIFAGVDLILDEASDSLYVLECNPAPFFRNFEAQTGLGLSEALARHLVEEASK